MNVKIETLVRQSATGTKVKNTLFVPEGPSDHLVILLPGLGYHCGMPLLYFGTSLALELGGRVLQVEYDYSGRSRNFDAEFERHLLADVLASIGPELEQEWNKVTLIGKSLGTWALAILLDKKEELFARAGNVSCVWLTPLLRRERVVSAIREWEGESLVAIGTEDPYFDREAIDSLSRKSRARIWVVEGADHSLDMDSSVEKSLEIQKEWTRELRSILS